jgi:TRAP-type mannitol/chloroaromatic compound transport system permease large subunit
MAYLGFDPAWFAILIAVNLQTSFLTPPFGYALFYLKSVAPPGVTTAHIYKGIAPFVVIQLIGLLIVALFPELVLWLPRQVFGM